MGGSRPGRQQDVLPAASDLPAWSQLLHRHADGWGACVPLPSHHAEALAQGKARLALEAVAITCRQGSRGGLSWETREQRPGCSAARFVGNHNWELAGACLHPCNPSLLCRLPHVQSAGSTFAAAPARHLGSRGTPLTGKLGAALGLGLLAGAPAVDVGGEVLGEAGLADVDALRAVVAVLAGAPEGRRRQAGGREGPRAALGTESCWELASAAPALWPAQNWRQRSIYFCRTRQAQHRSRHSLISRTQGPMLRPLTEHRPCPSSRSPLRTGCRRPSCRRRRSPPGRAGRGPGHPGRRRG